MIERLLSKKKSSRRMETAIDVIKGILQWIVVTALSFVYWMAVLLLLSLFLMNIWITSIEKLLWYGIILTVITGVAYGGYMLWKKFH